MKQYNNGQRPTKMYGGGMAMPRKPMMYGGLTQQKKFGMGYNLGGAIAKFEGRQKKALGGKNAKPDYLDFDKDGDKTESMKKALKDKKGKGKA